MNGDGPRCDHFPETETALPDYAMDELSRTYLRLRRHISRDTRQRERRPPRTSAVIVTPTIELLITYFPNS